MTLQIIKSITGKDEYVLLPINVYKVLRGKINAELNRSQAEDEYVPFEPEDYIDNPVALLRIKLGITQEELAKRMKVSQAYICKVEKQAKVSLKLLQKVKNSLKK